MNANVLLVSPPSEQNLQVMRTYSGGFGDVQEKEENVAEVSLPPIELY